MQAYEMTADQYIEAIGGRDESIEDTMIWESRLAAMYCYCEKICDFSARGEDYVLAKDSRGVYAFLASDISASDDGDCKAVAYFVRESMLTCLYVGRKHQSRGLGGELVYLARKDNPLQKSGGMSAGGVALNRKFHARLVAEAKSAGLI